MDSLRVRNLRSLVDTGEIAFRRINIFVGKNSSGKSTFVRTLPLLKQSSQVKSASDILWYGPLVDFGSLDESISTHASSGEVGFDIGMSLLLRRHKYRYRTRQSGPFARRFALSLRLGLSNDTVNKSRGYATRYTFSLFDHSVEFVLGGKLEVRKFFCNGLDFTESAKREFHLFRYFGVLPSIASQADYPDEQSDFHVQMAAVVGSVAHRNVSATKILQAVSSIEVGANEFILSQLRAFDLGNQWKSRLAKWTVRTPEFKEIAALALASRFVELFEAVGDHLSYTSKAMYYVSPLRATAERYYRNQGLSVDEIDSQGRNLATFLNDLSDEDANRFAEWTSESMGFEVRAVTTQGHISVVLSDPGKSERINLADTGFGFSQVLPILAQLWRGREDRSYNQVPRFFVFEQPELHLHPKMQSKLGALFVNLINSEKHGKGHQPTRFVIETHSESIINRIGAAVENGDLSPEDVSVYLFEKDELGGATTVRESSFDKDGYLTNWPYGFFD